MKCIMCKEEIDGGLVVYTKEMLFIQLYFVNPHKQDFEAYNKEESRLLSDGWEEATLCQECHLLM